MSEPSEIEVHERAARLFESENAGRFWRVDPRNQAGQTNQPALAGLSERQMYLMRAREELRSEGAGDTA